MNHVQTLWASMSWNWLIKLEAPLYLFFGEIRDTYDSSSFVPRAPKEKHGLKTDKVMSPYI